MKSRGSKLGNPGATVAPYLSNETLDLMSAGSMKDYRLPARRTRTFMLLDDFTESHVAGVSS